jgi:hypothetical protein
MGMALNDTAIDSTAAVATGVCAKTVAAGRASPTVIFPPAFQINPEMKCHATQSI